MIPADAQRVQGPLQQRPAPHCRGARSLQLRAWQPASLNPAHIAWVRQTAPSWQPALGAQFSLLPTWPRSARAAGSGGETAPPSPCLRVASIELFSLSCSAKLAWHFSCLIPLPYRGRALCFALQGQVLYGFNLWSETKR